MEGHIWIDGVITDNYHLDIKRQLAAVRDADTLVLHIQSPGGSVYAGYNTYHLLKSSGKKIKTIIEGEAQSMATFIALAGDEIEIRNPSVFMIHNPSSGIEGDADTMLNGASELRNIENDMAQAYARRTRLPVEQIKDMMKKTTVLNAVEAQRFGFVDRVIDPLRMVAIGNKIKMEDTKEINTESMFDKLLSGLNGLVDSFKEQPKAAAAPGIEPAPEQPKQMPMLPEGEYPLQDGRVIVIDEMGMIVEVKGTPNQPTEPMPEPMPMEPEPEDGYKKKMEEIQAQLDALKSAVATAVDEKNKSAQMLGKVTQELEVLKKKTVGDDAPPAAGAKFDRSPVMTSNEDQYADLKNEVLAKAGLTHLIKNRN